MASVALTTVFTPPASCFDNSYTFYAGSDYVKDTSIASTECYPPGFRSLFTAQIPYSPGICPESYSTAAQSGYTSDTDETVAVCCPTGFSNDDGLGCYSGVTAPTVLATPGGQVTVTSGVRLGIHGVYILLDAAIAPSTYSTSTTSTQPDRTSSSEPMPTTSTQPDSTPSSESTLAVSTAFVTIVTAPSAELSTSSTSSTPVSSSSTSDIVASVPSTRVSTVTVVSIQPSPTTSITNSSPSASPAANSTTATTLDPQPSHGLSTGAKAGIGVGSALGGIAIIGVVAWWLLARRRINHDFQDLPVRDYSNPQPMNIAPPGHKRDMSELSSDGARSWPVEADSRVISSELQGSPI